MPSVEGMKKIDFDTEKEIGMQLDFEYSLGIEFTDEIVPNALEYFVGVTHETEEEFEEYMHEMMIKKREKK
jgi:histidinol phosphatase-like PHP family hydrolase